MSLKGVNFTIFKLTLQNKAKTSGMRCGITTSS